MSKHLVLSLFFCFFFLNSCVCLKMPQTEPHLATGYLGNVSLLEKGGCQKPPAVVVKGLCSVTQSCPTLCDPMDCSLPGSSVQGDSPGKNTGVGCCALLQGIFPTQGSNPGLPHCRWLLYHLHHQGSPRIQEWVAHPCSRGSSHPGIKPALPHCRRSLHQLSYRGSQRGHTCSGPRRGLTRGVEDVPWSEALRDVWLRATASPPWVSTCSSEHRGH